MTIKSIIVGVAVAIGVTTSATTALAHPSTSNVARAGTAPYHDVNAAASPGIKWTAGQLQSLADAYRAKNPGWRAPVWSGLHSPADRTWTAENLDRLADAYTALNPGWTRP
jgi:hypothetical protein